MLSVFKFFGHLGHLDEVFDVQPEPPPPNPFAFTFDLSTDTGRGFFSLLMFG